MKTTARARITTRARRFVQAGLTAAFALGIFAITFADYATGIKIGDVAIMIAAWTLVVTIVENAP